MIGAMAFVTGVRLILGGIAYALSYPVGVLNDWLPNTESSFPRLQRLKSWFVGGTLDNLPEWAEYNGSFTILLKTNVGADRLESIVNHIPDTAVNCWLRFAVAAMVVFLVAWGVLLLAAIVLAARAAWVLILASIEWVLTFDWASLLEPRAMPSPDPIEQVLQLVNALPDVAYTIGVLTVTFIGFAIFYWLLMLFFLPGLTLHEWGHYAAIRKAGASVESYGVLLFGPLPGGAFVEPGEDAEDLDAKHQFGIWSAGIANSMIWGTVVLTCGYIISPDPTALLQTLYTQDYGVLGTQPLPSILLAVGIVEVANGFVNAVPIGPVDGGGFIRTAEEELWGIDDSTGYRERIRQLRTVRKNTHPDP